MQSRRHTCNICFVALGKQYIILLIQRIFPVLIYLSSLSFLDTFMPASSCLRGPTTAAPTCTEIKSASARPEMNYNIFSFP